MKPTEEQGYLISAFNTKDIDYQSCACKLAQSLKTWNPDAKVCLVTDVDPNNKIFDFVKIVNNVNPGNPYANDWQIFWQTPFRETIKLEADMLIVSNIDHWWQMLRHRDIVISTGCRNWKDQLSTARDYRKVFDINDLPDVYNAITYWRLSQTARDFFTLVKSIFENWNQYKTLLKFPEEIPSTDVVYAMAAKIIGIDKTTMPFTSYPKIVHMKKHHSNTKSEYWNKELVWEYNNKDLRIQTLQQWGAFHYYVKPNPIN